MEKGQPEAKIMSVIYGARMKVDRQADGGLLLEGKGYKTNGHCSGLSRRQKQ